MMYRIELASFSGPLDLLLHLIQKQELNIHDIPIALVTEQYLEYLRAMEELSLEIASEFLVMAATLLYIKSRMLLPRPPRELEEDDATDDPRRELVEQLLEYQRFKAAAEVLKARWETQRAVAYRPPMDLRPYAPEEAPVPTGLSIWKLLDAYRRVLRKLPDRQPVAEIPDAGISVEEAVEWVRNRLVRWRRCRFDDLAGICRSRNELVAVFLAVLELVKAGAIRVRQSHPFDEIHMEWREADLA